MKTLLRGKNIRLGMAAGMCAALVGFASPASADDQINFAIEDGQVTPSETFAAKVKVLGAAIQSKGVDMPVTLKVMIGSETIEPFGSYSSAADGDVNRGSARAVIPWMTFEPGSAIRIEAKSWETGSSETYLKADSYSDSQQVLVLRNGDAVPAIKGFKDQGDLASFVTSYVDTESGTIALSENEAIYLFELGTTNMNSSAADFQDLVVVIELGESPEALSGEADQIAAFD